MSSKCMGIWKLGAMLLLVLLSLSVRADPLPLMPLPGGADRAFQPGEVAVTRSPGTDSASQPANWRFQTPPLNLGLTGDRVWVRFQVSRARDSPEEWVLLLDNATLGAVDLQAFPAGQPDQGRSYETGLSRPFHQRPLQDSAFAFPLSLPPDQVYEIHLQLQTQGHMRIPLELMPRDVFVEERFDYRLLQGAYFGLMLVIALASLVIFFSIRDRTYLYYTAFIISVGLWVFIRQGFAAQYLWPDLLWWNERAYIVMLAVGAGMSVLFTREFLSLRQCHPPLARVTKWLTRLWWLLAAYALFFPTTTTLKVVSVVLLIGGTLLLFSGVTAWRRGVVEAGFYVLAWTIIIIGAIAIMLAHLGLLPGNNLPFTVFQIGSALEGFLLSVGLAIRLNHELKNRAEAERRALQMTARLQRQTIEDQQRHARELEGHVEERTQKLSQTLEQLTKVNEELERISVEDSLTGLYNRRHFSQRLDQEWRLAFRNQTPLTIIMLDIDYFKQINDTYGHVAGDQCLIELSHLLKQEVQRPSDMVARFGGEEFIILLPNTVISGAQHVAERIRLCVEEHRVNVQENTLHFTVSLGIADTIPNKASDQELLIRRSDDALYQAKEDGRNRVVVAS